MNSVFQQEQQRVNSVMAVIDKRIGQLEQETAQRQHEVINIRKHFWDEVKVNTDTFDDFLETIMSLRQESQALSVSQSTHQHAANRLATLHRMQHIPYFGRIDFQEQGAAQEQIYIGVASLMNDSGEDFLIYDWRAPISSVYYDYQPGPASYNTPEGKIHGDLQKKWQYLIRDGELQSMFDTSWTIGDEILQQVLGQGTNKYMNSIVATIQQEQNRIIRHEKGRLLVVHGTAGSGKTSAALQRIAYLLYKHRNYLKADQIILFSPNAMFNSYVSNVLPELGEENMQQVTFQDYLNHRLREAFHLENPYDQLEYVLTAAHTAMYKTRVASIQFKASMPFFEIIQSYRESLAQSGMRFNGIQFKGQQVVTAEQMLERFYTHDRSRSFHNRIDKLKDWLMLQIKQFEKAQQDKQWVQDEMELLSNEFYHKAHAYLGKKRGYQGETLADYEMEPAALAALVVRQKLKPLRKGIQALDFVDMKGVYGQLFTETLHVKGAQLPAEWTAICALTITMLKEDKLYYEDATPYLLMKELIQGFQTNRAIKHILIDEAQDYSPFQFEFLKRLFPAAKMTVLGDFNQAIFAHASDTVDFHLLNHLYGEDETAVINLHRSYRSTKPIIDFTRSLIPNGAHILAFERAGKRPTLTQVTNYNELHEQLKEKVAAWRQAGYESIAIICQSAQESKQAYEALASIDGIKLIKNSSSEYEQGVVVIPSYLSKGIEFEAVIIYDASEKLYSDANLRRLFYTACTRAMHELQLYHIGKMSPFLQQPLQQELVHAQA